MGTIRSISVAGVTGRGYRNCEARPPSHRPRRCVNYGLTVISSFVFFSISDAPPIYYTLDEMERAENGKKKLLVQWIRFRNVLFLSLSLSFASTRVAYTVLIIRFTIYREDLSFLIIVLKFLLFSIRLV